MSGKRQALDLLTWARLRLLHCEDDGKITVSKRDFADLLALAERAPLYGGPNVKGGRELIRVYMIWHRTQSRYRELREGGEDLDNAVKTAVSEFAPLHPDVFEPFGRPLSFATLKRRVSSHWSPKR